MRTGWHCQWHWHAAWGGPGPAWAAMPQCHCASARPGSTSVRGTGSLAVDCRRHLDRVGIELDANLWRMLGGPAPMRETYLTELCHHGQAQAATLPRMSLSML